MSDWQDIKTAPDDTPVYVLTEKGEVVYARRIFGAVVDDDERDCWAWVSEDEDDHPPCWTDGTCWATNENGVPSDQPVKWAPTPACSRRAM